MTTLKFDEFGLLEVGCLMCGTVIMKRDVWQGARMFRKLSNYRKTDINILHNGRPSVVGLDLCAEHINNYDPKKCCDVIMDNMKETQKNNGYSTGEIDIQITEKYTLLPDVMKKEVV